MAEARRALHARMEAGAHASHLWRHYANTTSLSSAGLALIPLDSLIAVHSARLDHLYDAIPHNSSAFNKHAVAVSERLKATIDIYSEARILFYVEAFRHLKQAPNQTLESYIRDLETASREQPVLKGDRKFVLSTFIGLPLDVQCAILAAGKTFLHKSLPEFIRVVRFAQRDAQTVGGKDEHNEDHVVVDTHAEGLVSDFLHGRTKCYGFLKGQVKDKKKDSDRIVAAPPTPRNTADDAGLPADWEVRHSYSRGLPYYFNICKRFSRWEPPFGTDKKKLKVFIARLYRVVESRQDAQDAVEVNNHEGRIRAANLLARHIQRVEQRSVGHAQLEAPLQKKESKESEVRIKRELRADASLPNIPTTPRAMILGKGRFDEESKTGKPQGASWVTNIPAAPGAMILGKRSLKDDNRREVPATATQASKPVFNAGQPTLTENRKRVHFRDGPPSNAMYVPKSTKPLPPYQGMYKENNGEVKDRVFGNSPQKERRSKRARSGM